MPLQHLVVRQLRIISFVIVIKTIVISGEPDDDFNYLIFQ